MSVVIFNVRCLQLSICILLSATNLFGGNWANWRGPDYNGSSNEKDLPVKFGVAENVHWQAPLPGVGASTPVIFNATVFLTSTKVGTDQLFGLCFDRKTGKEKWQVAIGSGTSDRSSASFANASAVTDGRLVVFMVSSGEIAGFDYEGNIQWQRNIATDYGDFAFLWPFGTSPLLIDGVCYIPVLQRDEVVGGHGSGDMLSYILALEIKTGKTVFKMNRTSKAKRESLESYTTMMPYQTDNGLQLLLAGGDRLTGHDLKTGQQIWFWETYNLKKQFNFRLVASPLVIGKDVLICAPQREPLFMINGGGKGDISKRKWKWSLPDKLISSDTCTPALYENNIYLLNGEKKYLMKLNPKDGAVVWQVPLPGKVRYFTSPTVAEDKVYCMNQNGTAVVLSTKDGKILNVADMAGDAIDHPIRSSMPVAHGQLFIRTNNMLYCIGK